MRISGESVLQVVASQLFSSLSLSESTHASPPPPRRVRSDLLYGKGIAKMEIKEERNEEKTHPCSGVKALAETVDVLVVVVAILLLRICCCCCCSGTASTVRAGLQAPMRVIESADCIVVWEKKGRTMEGRTKE